MLWTSSSYGAQSPLATYAFDKHQLGAAEHGYYKPYHDAAVTTASLLHRAVSIATIPNRVFTCCYVWVGTRKLRNGALREVTCWRCLACPGCIACSAAYYTATSRSMWRTSSTGPLFYPCQLTDTQLFALHAQVARIGRTFTLPEIRLRQQLFERCQGI